MEKDTSCAYCMKDENPSLYQKFGYYICRLQVSDLYLFKEQSHLGRCIVVYKDHVSEMCDLSKEDRQAFIEDINRVALAIHKAFKPDKLNYGFYGDKGHHLHCHLCPKYQGGFEWGGVFLMDPDIKKLSEDELKPIAAQIQEAL